MYAVLMNTLTALALAASALVATPAQADMARVSETSDMVPYVAQTWYDSVLADAGITLPANTIVALSNENNCGAEVSTIGLGGCTIHGVDVTVIVVSPGLADTEVGQHILLHEAGHALGFSNECDAEYFAHNWSTKDLWAYPECEETQP